MKTSEIGLRSQENESYPEVGVQLNRACPYHKYHEFLTQKIAEKHGIENTLILIGSSNNVNPERSPYTFAQRYEMIRQRWSGVLILPLPDQDKTTSGPKLNGNRFDAWIQNLKKLEQRLKVRFHFYGGSEADVGYLRGHFPADVLIDRETIGNGVSATQLREALHLEIDQNKPQPILEENIPPHVLLLAREYLRQNFRTIFNQHAALVSS